VINTVNFLSNTTRTKSTPNPAARRLNVAQRQTVDLILSCGLASTIILAHKRAYAHRRLAGAERGEAPATRPALHLFGQVLVARIWQGPIARWMVRRTPDEGVPLVLKIGFPGRRSGMSFDAAPRFGLGVAVVVRLAAGIVSTLRATATHLAYSRRLMMAANDHPPSTSKAAAAALIAAVNAIFDHRGVQTAAALWVVAFVAVVWLAQGTLPFDRPAVAQLPFALQIAAPSITLVEIFVLMCLVFLLTRGRGTPDMAARAPERRIALRETILVITYAAIGQVGGWIVGPALGHRAFSFHIAGTVFGCSVPPQPVEVGVWASYNFVVFAAVPYFYFRRRHTNTRLNLHSTNRRNDALVIFAVLVIESAFELAVFNKNIFGLSSHQILLGAPLTFLIFFVGTVMPTMILIYSILLPRYLKLTGSAISTVLLGGLTYAAMHIVEGWSAFDSPRDTTLSLIFVLLQYVGPGMFKSVLTLRTGNAWVHALSYHIVAPHVIVDTPLITKAFGIV